MFNGVESVGKAIPLNDSENTTELKAVEDTPSLDKTGSVAVGDITTNAIRELQTRMSDVEAVLPEPTPPDSFDTQMAELPMVATLEEVISAVNELIKRNAR